MDGKLSDLSVFIVEDHDFQRMVAEQTISGIGVKKLQVAADGQQALSILNHSETVDIIVCDLQIPGMDGIQFIRRVAELQLAHSLIILTALDSNLTRHSRRYGSGFGPQSIGFLAQTFIQGSSPGTDGTLFW